MNIPPPKQVERQKVLIGRSSFHKGMLFGIVSNGGKFNVGEYQVEIVGREGNFVKIQLHRYAIDAEAEKQTWVRTKTQKQILIKEVPKKQTVITELKIDGGVKNTDLF